MTRKRCTAAPGEFLPVRAENYAIFCKNASTVFKNLSCGYNFENRASSLHEGIVVRARSVFLGSGTVVVSPKLVP